MEIKTLREWVLGKCETQEEAEIMVNSKFSKVEEQIEWLESRIVSIKNMIHILGHIQEFSNNVLQLREELEYELNIIMQRIKKLKGE
jgi:hypothetical protein